MLMRVSHVRSERTRVLFRVLSGSQMDGENYVCIQVFHKSKPSVVYLLDISTY